MCGVWICGGNDVNGGGNGESGGVVGLLPVWTEKVVGVFRRSKKRFKMTNEYPVFSMLNLFRVPLFFYLVPFLVGVSPLSLSLHVTERDKTEKDQSLVLAVTFEVVLLGTYWPHVSFQVDKREIRWGSYADIYLVLK